MKKPAIAQPKRYSVKMRSVGNPDFRQYGPVSDPETVITDTLEQAAQECSRYIGMWDLGGGNWPETLIYFDGKPAAEVSYNGRLWKPGRKMEPLQLEEGK